MSKSSAPPAIRLRGVRHNNLKNFDLDLPLNHLVVITGLSGSGKSSLAFDTLFAEGQRRYIETFSPYARQFFDRMDKPQVDSIEGIPPAIAIEQRNAVKTTRSTVGTMTEICDYVKLLWPHIAQLHCRQCGKLVRKDSPHQIWESIHSTSHLSKDGSPVRQRTTNINDAGKREVLITFEVPLSQKLSLHESLALIAKQGYQRLLLQGQIVRLDELQPGNAQVSSGAATLVVIQDRLKVIPNNRSRFVEACEQTYHFGKGRLAIHEFAPDNSSVTIARPRLFSNRCHCAQCDIEYREPSPALFSFNHPVGACPACKGFGRIISIDYDLAIPDRSKTLVEGVVKPWLSGMSAECHTDLLKMCRHFEIPTDVPFDNLAKKWQDFVIEGEPDYGKDEEHEWPRAWYGVKGYFRWLQSKAYKMHVRVLLSRYRAYTTCPDCQGARFQPEALLYKSRLHDSPSTHAGKNRNDKSADNASIVNPEAQITLADFYALPIRDALSFIESLAARRKLKSSDPFSVVLQEVRSRLGFLNDVGLGYLTLDRPTRSLSGGETERVNLTTCLGTRLVNTLFVLDEPSVGLHPRDTERLVRILLQLRSAGNTVVVVEHEASVMRAADQLIDLGPGHGATGGRLVFQGSYQQILKSKESLTGQYLSARNRIELPERRSVRNSSHAAGETLQGRHDLNITGAARNNLKNLSVCVPLGRFVCLTGVSGSGKTTLLREVLLPALEAKLKESLANKKSTTSKASDRIKETEERQDTETTAQIGLLPAGIQGHENLHRVVLVDQSILGKTPRSNPAVYIGAFDDIRGVFAQSEQAKQRGFNASAFSFNSSQGQCERCRGAGFEKIEMQFLSDVFIRCPDCDGRRYRSHILEVKIQGGKRKDGKPAPPHRVRLSSSRKARNHSASTASAVEWSIADMLDATVDEAVDFLAAITGSRPAQRATQSLKLLQEVGLGYLRLGQPINTLSGGESQRLKLVSHLAEAQGRAEFHAVPRLDPQPLSDAKVLANRTAPQGGHTLFLFDEPTTGLHFDDVRVLLKVFQRLVDSGNSVIVIEHNLDVIKSADWLIDLGPDAGDEGGQIVAEGTPEQIAACAQSHTGRALKPLLQTTRKIK